MANKIFSYICTILLLTAIAAAPASAQSVLSKSSLNGVNTLRTFVKQKQKIRTKKVGSGWQKLKTVSLTVSVPSYGNLPLKFSQIKYKNWKSTITKKGKTTTESNPIIMFKGKVTENARIAKREKRSRKSYPVAGIYYKKSGKDQFDVTFLSNITGSSEKLKLVTVQTALRTTGNKQKSTATQTPPIAYLSKLCGNAIPELNKTLENAAKAYTGKAVMHAGTNADTAIVLKLSTQADYEWYLKYGSNSNSQVASLVNTAAVIYERDFGLDFDLVKQNVYASSDQPFNSMVADDLIVQFQNYNNSNQLLGNASLFFMFSGKSLQDSVLGIAYLGATCVDASYSYGLMQTSNSSVDPIVVAHEIGHTFSAVHDDSSPATIMETVISNPPPQEFSSLSQSQIYTHILQYGSGCLYTGTISPTPTPNPEPLDVAIVMGSSLSKSGVVSLKVKTKQARSDCKVTIKLSEKRWQAAKGTVLKTFPLDNAVTEYRVNMSDKAGKVNLAGAVVYLTAGVQCGSKTAYAAESYIKPSNVNSNRPAVTLNQWISILKNKLSVASPVN